MLQKHRPWPPVPVDYYRKAKSPGGLRFLLISFVSCVRFVSDWPAAMTYPYSSPAVAVFVVLPTVLAALFLWAVIFSWRRSGADDAATSRAALLAGLVTFAWMAVTWTAASSGILREWDRRPPPFAFLVLGIIGLSALMAFSGVGRRIARFVPLWALVAVQAFRLPLELAMHAMSERGIMPGVMSYSGRNFDIVTGASAIIVALLTRGGLAGRRLVIVWNVVGMLLLANVVIVAILATPAIRYFGDRQLNVWVTYPPFVWLPAVLVLAALAGHMVIFRALSAFPRSRPSAGGAGPEAGRTCPGDWDPDRCTTRRSAASRRRR
jgi:hypothetical protein